MIRAGFDAKEMANFLRIMEDYSEVQREILKINKKVSELLKTHPNSSKRVQEVIENYKGNIVAELFDFNGKLLETTKNTTFSLEDYPKGVYLLKVTYGDKVEEVKVIKE